MELCGLLKEKEEEWPCGHDWSLQWGTVCSSSRSLLSIAGFQRAMWEIRHAWGHHRSIYIMSPVLRKDISSFFSIIQKRLPFQVIRLSLIAHIVAHLPEPWNFAQPYLDCPSRNSPTSSMARILFNSKDRIWTPTLVCASLNHFKPPLSLKSHIITKWTAFKNRAWQLDNGI